MIMAETSATALSNDASLPRRRELEMRWKRREVKEEVSEADMKLERHRVGRTFNIKRAIGS